MMMTTVRKKRDFHHLRNGCWVRTATIDIQLCCRRTKSEVLEEGTSMRFGFIVSRKLGKAVERNRARRRMKAAVMQVLADLERKSRHQAWPVVDIGLVARPNLSSSSYGVILADLQHGVPRAIGRMRKQSSTRAVSL